MANATIQQFILLLMPIIGDQLPSNFLSPSFAAAVSGNINQYLVQFLQLESSSCVNNKHHHPM
jgi:hypothetical protein